MILRDVFDIVFNNLQIRKHQMQATALSTIRRGKVWMKVKFFKSGENRKLAPRYSGPWTVLRKLPNGVTLRLITQAHWKRRLYTMID